MMRYCILHETTWTWKPFGSGVKFKKEVTPKNNHQLTKITRYIISSKITTGLSFMDYPGLKCARWISDCNNQLKYWITNFTLILYLKLKSWQVERSLCATSWLLCTACKVFLWELHEKDALKTRKLQCV